MSPLIYLSIQCHLPLEIWLCIVEILAPLEQKVLSRTCRTFFTLVNQRCPFQVLRLYGDKPLDLLMLHKHSRVLKVARELHWLPSRKAPVRARSDGSFSLACLSIQYVLLKLSHSSAIRALHLHRIAVSPHHQRLILSIPSLRHLTLQQSEFIPGSVPMPHALIESLSFGTGTISLEAAIYTLRLLVHSLKSLDVGDASEVLYTPMNTLRFAVLKSLRQNPTTYLHHFHTLSPHTSITELYLGPSTSQQWEIPVDYFQPPHLLPHLQHLSSPWRVAVRIIPGRPVKVFHDTELMGYIEATQWRQLALSTARQGMEEIRHCHNNDVIGLLFVLNIYVPRLKRLEVFLSGRDPLLGMNWNPAANTSIIEIEIRFSTSTSEYLFLLPNPRANRHRQQCRTLLKKLAQACPKLEQVTFIEVNKATVDGGSIFDENEQDVPSDFRLKFCKMFSEGTWKEHLW